MLQTIYTLLTQYLSEEQKIYGAYLKSVILYGSYARWDYTSDSDALSELGSEYNMDYDIWIMPVVKNLQHFKQWAVAYPFYWNVQKEGVVLIKQPAFLDVGTKMDVIRHANDYDTFTLFQKR